MESKKINQLATELSPVLSDLTIIGDPSTGVSKKITLSQMASLFTGTVEEYPNLASFPLVGTADTIYIALDTNIIYRWNTGTSAYVELSPNIVTSLVFSDANGFDGTISLVGSTATLTITTALTTGSVPFIGASGALSQDNANLFFDDTNNRLGINTNSPTTALDVFGSGIIGRINGTSTNNAFLGFASAGTNKWSIGNVQSDHRFRIYSEANTSELVSVLQTGEFGIGIANPTTKLHIDGGASALIANLDADTSISKSISFRTNNSARINLEVSGTESGSNAGMDFFIRRYSDAGSLIDTPLTITRSTGNATFVARVLAGSSSNTSNAFSGANNSLTEATLYLSNSNASGWSIYSNQGINYFAGNVGIGNTAPTVPLDITGSTLIRSMSGGALTIRGTDTLNSNFGITWTTTTYGGGIAAIRVARRGATDASDMMFFTSPNGDIPQERVRIDSTGAITLVGSNAKIQQTTSNSLAGDNAAVFYNSNANSYGLYIGAGSGTNHALYITDSTRTKDLFKVQGNGNVGIGTSSPSNILHTYATLPRVIADTSTRFAVFNLYYQGAEKGALVLDNQNKLITLEANGDNTYETRFVNGGSERMRITSGGYLGINTTNPGGRLQVNGAGSSETTFQINDGSSRRVFCIPSQYYGYIFAISVAADGGKAISFGSTSQECGSIVCNTSSLTINYSSDYRLKEDFKDFTAVDVLTKVKLYDFKWKAEQTRDYGVIAHELQEIMPNMVTGEKDALDHEGRIAPQGVDYIRFVPILMKAIQEQQKQIEELKQKLK
jgi:hypothetical protein